MLGKTHKVGGICAGVCTAVLLAPKLELTASPTLAVAGLLFGSLFGSLLPDIDHPNSTISHKMPLLSKVITTFFGHRGMTHTFLVLFLTTFLGLFSTVYMPVVLQTTMVAFFIGYAAGYASHLFLDALTPAGIPVFFPFYRKNVRLAHIRTGSHDGFVSFLCICATGVFVYAHYFI